MYVGGFLCAGGGPKKPMQEREKDECQLCLAHDSCYPHKWMQGQCLTEPNHMIIQFCCKKLLLIPFIVHVYQMQFGALEEMGIMSHTAYLSCSFCQHSLCYS